MEESLPSSTVGHHGRVAVVTGAARGLGRAIAQGLAGAGAAVVGVDLLDLKETGQLVDKSGADWLPIQTDISSETQIEVIADQVLRRFGRCDILINCAGVGDNKTWDELDFADWRRILSINLDSQFLMCKAIVPLMKLHNYGRIVSIASSTVKAAMSTMIAYRVSKMGLIGLTRGLASLGDVGITANAVTPSLTKTGLTVEVGIPEERYAVFTQGQSIKRIATPEDLVPTVLFLSSAESYWVTGQCFVRTAVRDQRISDQVVGAASSRRLGAVRRSVNLTSEIRTTRKAWFLPELY
jgi:NAD(P)-dependent dehydrogenase (short-subunit alcohol dehydrogenase family)